MKRSILEKRRNRIAALTVTAVAGIVIAFVLAEIAIRIAFPDNIPATERVTFFRYDALLGWSHVPGYRTQFRQRDFSIAVSINSLGLRDDEFVRKKSTRKRLLVIGDSFAWGFGVEQDQRFTEKIERLHPDWEVINAAVNGYGTDQQLLYLQSRGFELEPDIVLLLFHSNDFENNRAKEQYWYYKPRYTINGGALELTNVPVPRANVRQKMRRLILGRTYLGQTLLQFRRRMGTVGVPPTSNDVASILPGADVSDRLLREIAALSRMHRARFVLVSVPMSADKRGVLMSVAREEGGVDPLLWTILPFEKWRSSWERLDPPIQQIFESRSSPWRGPADPLLSSHESSSRASRPSATGSSRPTATTASAPTS